VSAEEEELLGQREKSNEDIKLPVEIDKSMLKFLDKLIFYLRIVHSVDYYNHCDYPNEDTMPNRMGMIHVREQLSKDGRFGKDEKGNILFPKSFVENFITSFNDRLNSTLLRKPFFISEEELTKLGSKDPEKAVEDFIEANSVELGPEKWLCPLSGKKFKGREFIRKHLQSKHETKLAEVRDDALYFNNFLADPSRPRNAEVKPAEEKRLSDVDKNVPRTNWSSNDRTGSRYSGGQSGGRSGYGYNREFSRPRYFEQDGGRRDPRQATTAYRDLDAPEEIF